jgi:hypothetical protein
MVGASAVWLLALAASQPATAQTIIPIDQQRSINTMANAPQCSGDFLFEDDAAVGFGPFDSFAVADHGCDSGFGFAFASQQSQIDANSMTAFGSTFSEAGGPIPGMVHAISDSIFEVTFQLDWVSTFALDGLLSADASGDAVGANAQIALTGPGNQTIFAHSVDAGPGGQPNSQALEEIGVLDPGTYTLRASAVGGIDNDVPPSKFAAGTFDFTFQVSIPGDLDGDGDVDFDDLGALVAVLLDMPLDPAHVVRADLNGDGNNDGNDIELFVKAILAT